MEDIFICLFSDKKQTEYDTLNPMLSNNFTHSCSQFDLLGYRGNYFSGYLSVCNYTFKQSKIILYKK